MKFKISVLVLPIAALSLGGCEAVAVVNLVGGILSPTPTHYAPAQNGPFRARTATEDMSPVLNEVADAKVSDRCKKILKKLTEAGADTLMGNPGLQDPDREPAASVAADADDGASRARSGNCMRKWVCLPAQDQPLLTTFCPEGQAVVERGTPVPTQTRRNEWAWDWK